MIPTFNGGNVAYTCFIYIINNLCTDNRTMVTYSESTISPRGVGGGGGGGGARGGEEVKR